MSKRKAKNNIYTMKYKKRGFWNKENCATEALKYTTKISFRHGNNSAYATALKNGWLDDICKHMYKLKEIKGFWTKENCVIEALKYKTKTEFQNKSSGCYAACLKNNWIEDVCSHMDVMHHTNNYWTKERCYIEALKYTTKKDFILNSNKSYRAALKKGWIDEICEHMIKLGDRYLRCIYAIEFEDNSVYIGLTYNIDKRFKDHITDVVYNKSSVLTHIKKTGLVPIVKQLSDYINITDASILEGEKEKEYANGGWIILNKIKCGGVGGNIRKWTKENCMAIAMQFSSRKNFRKEYPSVYSTCQKNKWLDELCSHFAKIAK